MFLYVSDLVCFFVCFFSNSYARVSVWVFVAGNGSVVRYEVFKHSWAVGESITRLTEMCVCVWVNVSLHSTYAPHMYSISKSLKTVCQYTVTVAVESNEVIDPNGKKRCQKVVCFQLNSHS